MSQIASHNKGMFSTSNARHQAQYELVDSDLAERRRASLVMHLYIRRESVHPSSFMRVHARIIDSLFCKHTPLSYKAFGAQQ